jgi:uncharacterized protein GlcG (DUF336 family)
MPTTFQSLNLDDAGGIIEAGLAKAAALGVPCSIAVVDAGGHLIGFARRDGAMTGSAELAINKAFSARIFNNSTGVLGKLARPDAELYGIQQSHGGRVVIFGGGVPVRLDGTVIGAVGVSGGTVMQDIEIANMAHASVFGNGNA